MSRAIRCIVALAAAAVFNLAAGCSYNTNFVYKPTPPAAGGPKLQVKAAVLPFEDGTENFTGRGSVLAKDYHYNLAKAAAEGTMNPLPPEFWGKSFADELAASGSFRAVRFVYSPSELQDEGFVVDGILKKAVFAATWDHPNEILVSFRAVRRSDSKVVWEKEIGKTWKTPLNVYDDCGLGAAQCRIYSWHSDWNKWMGGVLAEARADLVGTLASLSEGGTEGGAGAKPGGQPAPPESVDQTIDKILKGK